jgi:hypothetical protein
LSWKYGCEISGRDERLSHEDYWIPVSRIADCSVVITVYNIEVEIDDTMRMLLTAIML